MIGEAFENQWITTKLAGKRDGASPISVLTRIF